MDFRLYLARRLLLMIPTFFGITIINFGFIQLAPGGPVESYLAKMRYAGGSAGEHISGGAESSGSGVRTDATAAVIKELNERYGFDKPVYERYVIWLKNTLTLDFGYSHSLGKPVMEVIASKFPVSIRFGVAAFLITYLVCIPLGILKAVKDGSKFDTLTSIAVFLLYSVPYYMLAVLLIHVFAGGRYLEWFPLGGIASLDSEKWSTWERLKDSLWHMVLPLTCFVVNSFATLTLLMKNSIIEEVQKDYVRTARAKGLSEKSAILRHALRNSLVPLATGLGSIITVFFASNLLIETIFNLDGFGKLFYDAALQRDYPVLMGQVVIGAFLGLFAGLISDVAYVLVDPRINYSKLS
jgi:microcin C transport system permease protein